MSRTPSRDYSMDVQVNIRVSEQDKLIIKDLAKAKNLTVSHLIRNVLIDQGILPA
jgi:predicted DNA binding CopG/RHH family protein